MKLKALEELINKRLKELDMEDYSGDLAEIDDHVIRQYLMLKDAMFKRND